VKRCACGHWSAKVGEGRVKTQPDKFMIGEEGL
jgi:hypothetical protein